MPTVAGAGKKMKIHANALGGKIVRVGTKPWVYFYGTDADDRGILLKNIYEELYGIEPKFSGKPWREGQEFDYAVRIDS